jgi:hypothetical protein
MNTRATHRGARRWLAFVASAKQRKVSQLAGPHDAYDAYDVINRSIN